MTQTDFLNQQRAAVERMREMNSRSSLNNKAVKQSTPSANEKYAEKENGKCSQSNKNFQSNIKNPLQIPLLDKLLSDGDSVLIIGLLLILMSENADRMLLFALLYILM